MSQFNKLVNKRLSVHINFLEGRPISKVDRVPMLVGHDGLFHYSFFRLMKEYYLGSRKTKIKLIEQLKLEVCAQLNKVKRSLPEGTAIAIDSHQHFHMLPFLFEILVQLRTEYNISYIRIPKEKMFYCFKKETMKNYFGPNIIKYLLLNYLSNICLSYLEGTKIEFPDYFIGVLFTGNMSNSSIKSALSSINCKQGDIVELLLHPGGSTDEEAKIWKSYPQLKKYYLSSSRNLEKQTLLSDEFLVTYKEFNNRFL
jgi:chitin disaccharide deacetylase